MDFEREEVSEYVFRLLAEKRKTPLMPKEAYEFATARDTNYGIPFNEFEKVFWSVMNNVMAYALHNVITNPDSKFNTDDDIQKSLEQAYPHLAYDDVAIFNHALDDARKKRRICW